MATYVSRLFLVSRLSDLLTLLADMHECLDGAENQRFSIPAKWFDYQARSPQIYINDVRAVPTGLWNGQWNEQTICANDTLIDVLRTCDSSMSFLLGNDTSGGELREIAKLVNDPDYGPSYMPGYCCLDSPTSSEWFGYYVSVLAPDQRQFILLTCYCSAQYSTSVTYQGAPMECQNLGPWHLGMSELACSNAGGRWFQSPCYTLQTCINERPSVNETGYSPSFEQFADGIAIDNPSNQTQCGNARQQLGYDSDYPYDVDV